MLNQVNHEALLILEFVVLTVLRSGSAKGARFRVRMPHPASTHPGAPSPHDIDKPKANCNMIKAGPFA